MYKASMSQELVKKKADVPVDLTENNCLCIVGEYGGEIRQDLGGTNHRLIHNKEKDIYERYSLILDVEKR